MGDHRISIAERPGWESIDRGREVSLRRGEIRLSLRDLGPAGPVGIRREIEQARRLWRQSRPLDARWRLRRLSVPTRRFTTDSQREAFWISWNEVASAPLSVSPASVEAGFDRLLGEVAGLDEPTLEVLAEESLSDPGGDRRREVATRSARMVGGRRAIVVDTWGRATHEHRRRSAVIDDDGYLLEVRTEEGPWGDTSAALDELISALRFEPS